MRSDRILLHLLRLRIAEQPPAQEAQAFAMATVDHGRVGHCDGELHCNDE
jgi:hypothetical protein